VVGVCDKVVFLRDCALWKAQHRGQTCHEAKHVKTSIEQATLQMMIGSILKMKLNFNFKIIISSLKQRQFSGQ